MRANAAVFEKLFTPLSVTEGEIDAPRAGEVLVKIIASGVCHTDALARDGDMPFPAPGVLGHEGAGVVEAVGDGVTSVLPGDKVVIGWPWCGTCRNCLEGQPRYCLELGPLVIAGSRADGSTSLRRLDRLGIRLGGISGGPYILARARLLLGRRCTLHWEHIPAFREEFPDIDLRRTLFEFDQGRYTCAGGIASLDMMPIPHVDEPDRFVAEALLGVAAAHRVFSGQRRGDYRPPTVDCTEPPAVVDTDIV